MFIFQVLGLICIYQTLERILLELCVVEDGMHLVLSLVYKRWSEVVNRSFRKRVHIEWLDRKFSVANWSAETNKEVSSTIYGSKMFKLKS